MIRVTYEIGVWRVEVGERCHERSKDQEGGRSQGLVVSTECQQPDPQASGLSNQSLTCFAFPSPMRGPVPGPILAGRAAIAHGGLLQLRVDAMPLPVPALSSSALRSFVAQDCECKAHRLSPRTPSASINVRSSLGPGPPTSRGPGHGLLTPDYLTRLLPPSS